ncbi:MAG: hydrogenase maturation protease [Candidatus Sericytochromatia bacterium]|nr:hydrogenase maturation protease [Candidatus Sericytochromatia bacterium]
MLKPLLVLGIGNGFRKDDGLGPAIIKLLQRSDLQGVELQTQSGEGSSLMAAWQGHEQVVLVDAVCSGALPGTVFELEASEQVIPSRFFHYSTHAFSVAEAIEMAKALGELPQALTLFGIEGADFGSGTGLSPIVTAALPELLLRIHNRYPAYFQIFQGEIPHA